MWIGLLGAVQAAAKRQHLAIDLMAMKLKGMKKRILTVFIESCVIFFSSMVMIKGGYMLAMRTFATKQIAPALQIPMGYIYLIVPIAGALFILVALMFFSVPVSFSIRLATLSTVLISLPFDRSIFVIAQKMITGLDSFTLLALPFFVLAGNIMNRGGIAMRLINLAMVLAHSPK